MLVKMVTLVVLRLRRRRVPQVVQVVGRIVSREMLVS